MLGYVIKGIQEICSIDDTQDREIKSLKQENDSLHEKIALLEDRLSRLEGGM